MERIARPLNPKGSRSSSPFEIKAVRAFLTCPGQGAPCSMDVRSLARSSRHLGLRTLRSPIIAPSSPGVLSAIASMQAARPAPVMAHRRGEELGKEVSKLAREGAQEIGCTKGSQTPPSIHLTHSASDDSVHLQGICEEDAALACALSHSNDAAQSAALQDLAHSPH